MGEKAIRLSHCSISVITDPKPLSAVADRGFLYMRSGKICLKKRSKPGAFVVAQREVEWYNQYSTPNGDCSIGAASLGAAENDIHALQVRKNRDAQKQKSVSLFVLQRKRQRSGLLP